MRVAASIRGCSSGSSAPRSTASSSSRDSSKYERSSIRGSACRREASTSAAGRAAQRLAASGVHRRRGRAERPVEVHQLAACELQLEDSGGLVVDLLPRRGRDGGELPLQVVHRLWPPLRLPMPSEPPRRPRRAALTAAGSGLLQRDQRAAREEVLLEVRVHRGVPPPVPLEQHGEVLLLLVAVVGQDVLQILVGRRVDALIVPVGRLQLFLHGGERPVVVEGLRPQLAFRFVITRRVRHRRSFKEVT